MHNNAPKNEPFDWRYVIYVTAAFALFWTVGILVGEPADAAPPSVTERWTQPYGGCKEGWQAPRSEGAAECRAHGWTIRPRIVVGPRGVVRYHHLPRCAQEDGSGTVRGTCSWNFDKPSVTDHEASFWVSHHNGHPRYHYVWMRNPLRTLTHWHWSTRAERAGYYGLPRKCIVRDEPLHLPGPDSIVVRCAG
jgi:hypothetical protein